MDFLNQALYFLAQTGDAASTPASDSGGGDPASGGAVGIFEQLIANPLNLILISGFLFILLVMRPQQKQMKQLQEARANLKKNDRVVTASGIHGTVVQAGAGDTTIVLRIDDNSGARITINRDAIDRILSEDSIKETKAS